jgi:hypothetical protein
VFKYSNVVISNGATLSFLNHPTHAPVVWLVSNNVAINGTLSLNGQPWNLDAINLPEPGPGGFRGGGGFSNPNYGPGFGPGGNGGGGIYTSGQAINGLVRTYGNTQILPLIGGSGGAGGNFYGAQNGAAGGGAILIAAVSNITVNGYCAADGGSGGNSGGKSGSGGAIRLVANQIVGSGQIEAGGSDYGRIRLEYLVSASGSLVINNPPAVALQITNPPVIFPTANAPAVSVIGIVQSGVTNAVPLEPTAAMNSSGNDDLVLVTTNRVTVQLRTLNFPTNGTVTVFINPRYASQTYQNATLVGGNTNSALWQVTNVNLMYPAHTVIQARAAY